MKKSKILKVLAIAPLALVALSASADDKKGKHHGGKSECSGLAQAIGVGNNPVALNKKLREVLQSAVATESSGFNLDMWATLVNRDGVVCAVAFSGSDRGAQWPGSRVISAQKAYTANAFGLNGYALSTANLYSAVQPGGSLYGLQHSNPVDTDSAYKGPAKNFGQHNDPMVGERVGGVNVFGGGVGLYAPGKILVGAVGLSGDTSCADHNIAWRVRNTLNLDYVPLGPAAQFVGDATHPDNIVLDFVNGASTSGWGHPSCVNTVDGSTLPAAKP